MYRHRVGNLVASICEGNAELEIIEALLENELLKFTREELLDEEVFTKTMRSPRLLESRYLSQELEHGQKVEVIRVLDSRTENYRIQSPYTEKVAGEVITCLTRPEIEILLILAEDKFEEYKRSGLKPSDFCKQCIPAFKRKKIKGSGFVSSYFSDVSKLLKVLEKYHQIRGDKSELSIWSLLK